MRPSDSVRLGKWTIEIIKRSDQAKGFVLLSKPWVVERTLAWLGRNRRLAKNFEAIIASSTSWLYIASLRLISKRYDDGGFSGGTLERPALKRLLAAIEQGKIVTQAFNTTTSMGMRTVATSGSSITSLWSTTRWPGGGWPPTHMPFWREAANLPRMRSPITSRSN